MNRFSILAVAVLLMPSSPASAQAYCALRDPANSIYELFPKAQSYLSDVGTVTEEARKSVGEQLPFTLHFNELGRHTLYFPMRENEPIGFVHVRSERGQWGLVEIAWAIDMDMKITGFKFQRCRSRSRSTVETGSFYESVVGRSFRDLRVMLTEDGKAIREGLLAPEVDAGLALSVLRCGLKTLVVTETTWAQEVSEKIALSKAREQFGKNSFIESPPEQDWKSALGRRDQKLIGDAGIQLATTRLYRIVDADGNPLGTVLRTPWHLAGIQETLWWRFEEQTLRAIDCQGGWPTSELESLFMRTLSQVLDHESCSSPIDLAAHSARAIVGHLTK